MAQFGKRSCKMPNKKIAAGGPFIELSASATLKVLVVLWATTAICLAPVIVDLSQQHFGSRWHYVVLLMATIKLTVSLFFFLMPYRHSCKIAAAYEILTAAAFATFSAICLFANANHAFFGALDLTDLLIAGTATIWSATMIFVLTISGLLLARVR